MTIQDYHSEYQKLNHPDSGYFQVQLPIINRTEKAVCFDKNASDLVSQFQCGFLLAK
jgi:hypothetical protein